MGACGSKPAEPQQTEPGQAMLAKEKRVSPKPSGGGGGGGGGDYSKTDNDRQVDPAEVGVDGPVLLPPINPHLKSSCAPHGSPTAEEKNDYLAASAAQPCSASSASGGNAKLASAATTLVDVTSSQLHDHASAQLHSESVCHLICTDSEGETISCSADKSISMYNWRTKSATDKWSNHSKSVQRVAYSSKLRMLFSASRDNTIRQWRTHTFKEVASFRGHTLPVTGLLCHSMPGAGTSHLVSGGRDYSLRAWNVETGAQVAMRTLARNVVTNIRWMAPQQSMDGNAFTGPSVVSSSNGGAGGVISPGGTFVRSISIAPTTPPGGMAAPSDSSSSSSSSSTLQGGLAAEMGAGFDANCLLQCGEDSAAGIRIWDVRSLDVVAAFSVAGASAGAAVHTVDATSDPDDANYFVSVSNVQRSIGSTGDGLMSSSGGGGSCALGELKLWDRRRASSNLALSDGVSEPVLTIVAHTDAINAVHYLPSIAPANGRTSSFVATASKDRTLKVWDLNLSGSGDGLSSRCVQTLSLKGRFASEFTALALNLRHASSDAMVQSLAAGKIDPAAMVRSSAAAAAAAASASSAAPSSASSLSNYQGHHFVLYSACGNGALSAWHWNPNLANPQLRLVAHTKPVVTGNQRM